MVTQPDLFSASSASSAVQLPHGLTDADLANFRAQLLAGAWLTRADLCRLLGWPDRKVREVAELLGDEVVRGQLGFKLTDLVERDELGLALQAADAFHSQAAKMERYSLGLRRRLHSRIR